MEKWKSFLFMVALVLLGGICVYSCQVDDSDDYYQESESDVTPVDLFVASEPYQNLEKEIRKDIRRRINAINKLSEGEQAQYSHLMEQLLKPETRMKAREQLHALLGYDEQAERERIRTMVLEIYKGTNYSQMELLRAWQKRQMHQVAISTRANDPEAYQECIKKCEQAMELKVNECYTEFNECLKTVPAEEKLYQKGPRYDACVDSQNFCLDVCYFNLTVCKDRCRSSNGR